MSPISSAHLPQQTGELQPTPAASGEDRRRFTRYSRKLSVAFGEYNVYLSDDSGYDLYQNTQTVNISQRGILFNSSKSYKLGTLLKLKLKIPNYWGRKQKKVSYNHVYEPTEMPFLGRVVRIESTSSKKKNRIAVQTVSIDEVDDEVLKDFLIDNMG